MVDAARVEAGKEVRLGLADRVDDRRTPLGLFLDPLQLPLRHPADRLVGRQLGLRPPHVNVQVERVDPAGALLVGHPRDRPDERRVLDVGIQRDVLALFEVDPDPEREPRVLLELRGAVGPERAFVHGLDAIGVESADGERACDAPPRPSASG